jgi:RNA recognition motif-containing protein
MSVTAVVKTGKPSKGRKRDAHEAEIEVDVNAPEPPSKKALRKAKKAKLSTNQESSVDELKPDASTVKSEQPAEEVKKRSDHGIWIGNLSFGTTKDDLTAFLTKSSLTPAQITRVHLPLGKPRFGKPQSKGFAYIDFSEQACIDTALELSESVLDGRRVLVKNAKSFEGRPERPQDQNNSQGRPPNKKIFVGNLDFTTTLEDLENHFSVCGPIAHTHMATFEDTGKCKGFAWIEFEDISSAEKAIRGWAEAEGKVTESNPRARKGKTWVTHIQGRKLRMEFAEDKAVRYEKRYGKNAKTAPIKNVDAEEEGGISLVVTEHKEEKPAPREEKKAKKEKHFGNYSKETVTRLAGGIVEAQGSKTVFE